MVDPNLTQAQMCGITEVMISPLSKRIFSFTCKGTCEVWTSIVYLKDGEDHQETVGCNDQVSTLVLCIVTISIQRARDSSMNTMIVYVL